MGNREEKKPSRIVFVNQATGYLTIDIINEFAREFDKVAVIYGDIRVQDVSLDPKVKLTKVIEKSRKSNFQRLTRWLIASAQIFVLLVTKYRRFEIFYFSVPPFAYLSSLLIRRRYSLLMWDVYPDALVMAGMSEKNFVFKAWAKLNSYLFQRAYRIYTIGEVLKNQLSKYVKLEKVIVIPLWSGITNFIPVSKTENPFIIEQKLGGKFIVQYSGNIGAGHNIESLIEAARLTHNDPDIFYLITGRGSKVEKVRNMIDLYGLKNCMVLPFQPDNMIKYTLASADLSVVLVEDKIAGVSIPSKFYNLLAVGSPIISITPTNSEINKMIRYFENGRNFERDEFNELASFITEIKNTPEKLRLYKNRSIEASKEYSPANARKYLENYISSDL